MSGLVGFGIKPASRHPDVGNRANVGAAFATWATPEGLARINEGYRDSLPIAAAIDHSPAQLLNMPKDVHTIMAGKAAELWAPKGGDMLNEGLTVGKAVKGYDAVIGDIYSSYFN